MKALPNPMYDQTTSAVSGSFPFRTLRFLGYTLIVLGLLSLILGVVDVVYTAVVYPPDSIGMDVADVLVWTWISHGIWVGVVTVIAGGIGASFSQFRTHNLQQMRDSYSVIAGLVAFLFAPALMVLSALEIYYQMDLFYFDVDGELIMVDTLKFIVPLLMALTGFIIFCVGAAVVGVCCCCAPVITIEQTQPVFMPAPMPMHMPMPMPEPTVILAPPPPKPEPIILLPPPPMPMPIMPPPPPEPVYVPVPVPMPPPPPPPCLPPPPPEVRYVPVEGPPRIVEVTKETPPEVHYVEVPGKAPPPEVRVVEVEKRRPPRVREIERVVERPPKMKIVEIERERPPTPPPMRPRGRVVRVTEMEEPSYRSRALMPIRSYEEPDYGCDDYRVYREPTYRRQRKYSF